MAELIPDIIPEEKKPLEGPADMLDEDFDDDYEDDYEDDYDEQLKYFFYNWFYLFKPKIGCASFNFTIGK